MVSDSGPLYAYEDIPLKKKSVSSYNIHLHCISDQFDIILMDKKKGFSFKNKDISKCPQTFER